MITNAFTCTGRYAILIMLGIKRVENRSAMPVPSKGRCAISCSKSFCEAEYGDFVELMSRSLSGEDFKLIPAWADVCEWPGKIVGTCDYEVRRCDENAVNAKWYEGYSYWWDLSEIVCFNRPIPCRGNVGMWEMPKGLSLEVSRADDLMRASDSPIRTIEDAVRMFRLAMPVVGSVEGFFALPLDGTRRPLSAPVLISLGTENNTTIVSIGDVLREVLSVGAQAIIVAHNHPSGTLRASHDDVVLTQELDRIAGLLGVRLLDHLIITKDGFCRVKTADSDYGGLNAVGFDTVEDSVSDDG